MATDITVTITPPATKTVVIGNGITAHAVTHAPGGSDSLENYYATTGSLAYVSGQIGSPAGVVLITGNQGISGVKNFFSRPTVNGTGVLLSGEAATQNTGYLTGYVNKSETGNFLSSSQTGQLTGQFYPLDQNPSGYITGLDLSSYATIPYTTGISGSLQFQITALQGETGLYALKSQTGSFLTTGAGDTRYVSKNETGSYTGVFYPRNSNPSGYITGVDLTPYATIVLLTGTSGHLQGQIDYLTGVTGSFLTGNVVRPSDTGSLASTGFVVTVSGGLQTQLNTLQSGTGSYVLKTQTGQYTGDFYPRNLNPSGYITGVDLSNYTTISYVTGISGGLQSQITSLQSSTGTYVTGQVIRPSQTGAFYPVTNPSGYITGVDLSPYSTVVQLTGTSGYLQSQISNLNNATGSYVLTGSTGNFITGQVVRPSDTGSFASTGYVSSVSGYIQGQVTTIQGVTGSFALKSVTGAFLTTGAGDARYVSASGNQTITGIKDFVSRPTVNGAIVLVTGDSVNAVVANGVYTTGNQDISGAKNFFTRPTVNGTGVLLSGEGGGGGSSADNYSVYITGSYTASAGQRIQADTSGSAFTLTLMTTPSTGDTIYVVDPRSTWGVNNLTISGAGNRIFGDTGNLICDLSGQSITLVYVNTGIGYNVF